TGRCRSSTTTAPRSASRAASTASSSTSTASPSSTPKPKPTWPCARSSAGSFAQGLRCAPEGTRAAPRRIPTMDWFEAPEYWLSRFVFERALGVVYLVAFLVAVNQFRPLLGERGLLPVPRFVRMVRFRDAPSLFQLRYSDRLFSVVAWTGLVLAPSVILGLPQASAPAAYAPVSPRG